ncbi:MAG: TolC family protein [Deltaproteobacteria bacterium]|nr:TolC family protein [Deltaproteobacteria bacterium]
MLLILMMTILNMILATSDAIAAIPGEQGIGKILELIRKQNHSVQAASQTRLADLHAADGTGYFPEPGISLNVFGSPIETRNGPQRFNIVLKQAIPWPAALRAEEQLADSSANVRQEQLEILLLDLDFNAKSLIFKYAGLSAKRKNKEKMIASLNHLSKVVSGRLKLAAAGQAEVSRINIEGARLTQAVRTIDADLVKIIHTLKALTGGEDIVSFLPSSPDPDWGEISGFNADKIDVSSHPLIRLAHAKVSSANARIEQAKVRHLPGFGVSLSWFQIDPPDSDMLSSDAGKDAWAIGASVSVPIWNRRYNALEYSQIAQRSAAQQELRQRELDLKSSIHSIYEEYRSAKDIFMIFRNDILPQSDQALQSDQESYAQGNTPFDRMIESYIRSIQLDDQIIESQIRMATLKSALEKLTAARLTNKAL